MRLHLDEMYPRRLAERLRSDVVAVVQLPDLIGRPDEEVARYAREHRRVVVTENVADFAALDRSQHAGLLLVNARRWPRTPNGLPRLADALSALLTTRSAEPERVASAAGLVEWL